MLGLAEALGIDADRPREVIARCADRGLTIAAAESLTGGLLMALLTEVPGASAVVRGGLIVYATELKCTLAGVDATLLANRGPVDAEVARQLARGVRRRCDATLGVGLTGVAGPDPQGEIPAGVWFCALAGPGRQVDLRHRSASPGRRPTRADVRRDVVAAALDMLAHAAATTM